MTAVTQELTCPHERREIPDRDHNKRSFLAFFPFFSPPWNVGEQATVIDISHFISCWYISRVKA